MLKSISLALAGLAAHLTLAAPLESRQSTNIDYTVLQFALTLENLENFFYKQALGKFSAQDFTNAGFDSAYYSNLQYIATDEASHVAFLSGALTAAGQKPVQPCTYTFPYTDAKSFVTLSSVIEGVGTSAYLGAAALITSKDYLTAAGSILVTEAIHTSLQRKEIGEQPAANAYGTPLDPTSVFTLASGFIVQCPSSNYPLGFTPYAGLTYVPATSSGSSGWGNWQKNGSPVVPTAGSTVSFTVKSAPPAGSYLTFVSGLQVTSVKATISGNTVSAAVPSGVSGQSYVLLTSNAATGNKLSTATVVAGPAIVEVAPPPPSY